MHTKAKKSKRNSHWESFRNLRKQVNKAIIVSHNQYLNDVIGESLKTNSKTFWSYIKSSKTENIGIPSLQTESQTAYTDGDKANMLNNQFKSVFTIESTPPPDKGPSPYPSMPDIKFHTNGIIKQLQAQNPKTPKPQNPVSIN